MRVSAIETAKALIPVRAQPVVRGIYHRVYPAYVRARCAWLDLIQHRERNGIPIPPARLRFRVGEDVRVDGFLEVGRRAASALNAALERAGRRIETHSSVLDFGCGCGRVLRCFMQEYPGVSFTGSEVDAESVRWCAENFPSARFVVNTPSPPLPFDSGSFDFVYAVSVFTHLDETYQHAWIAELARVTKPGGFIAVTVHSEHVWQALPCGEADAIRERGFLFRSSQKLRGLLPEWYHTAYHSREYAAAMVSRHFRVIDYEPGSFGDQDLIVAERSGLI